MHSVLLSRVDKDATNSCHLDVGEHLVGRGPLLQCISKKVSRNHAVIRVSEDGVVTLTAIHHNPCFYLSNETKHMTVIKNGTSIQLHDGNQIALLPDEYWFKVKITNLNNTTNIDKTEQKGKKRENSENPSTEETNRKRLKSENFEENKENLLDSVHSTTINDTGFEISLNLGTCDNANLTPEGTSNLENVDRISPDLRSESPDFLDCEFNVENVNIPEESSPTDFIVVKGDVPGPSNADLQEPNLEPNPPKNDVPEQTPDDIDQYLLETLSDLQRNNEEADLDSSEKEKKEEKEVDKTSSTTTENLVQTAEDISIYILQTIGKTSSDEELKNNERIPINCIGIEIKKEPIIEEESVSSNVKVKDEPLSETEDTGRQGIVIQPVGELYIAEEVVIKQEPEDVPDLSQGVKIDDVKVKKGDNDDCGKVDSSTSTAQPSTSHIARERCYFGAACYRKNAQHKAQLSHPGDSDYGDVNVKPVCQFGSTCFRRNPRHYLQYDHPKPPGQAPKRTTTAKTQKRKKILQNLLYKSISLLDELFNDDELTDSDDYDDFSDNFDDTDYDIDFDSEF